MKGWFYSLSMSILWWIIHTVMAKVIELLFKRIHHFFIEILITALCSFFTIFRNHTQRNHFTLLVSWLVRKYFVTKFFNNIYGDSMDWQSTQYMCIHYSWTLNGRSMQYIDKATLVCLWSWWKFIDWLQPWSISSLSITGCVYVCVWDCVHLPHESRCDTMNSLSDAHRHQLTIISHHRLCVWCVFVCHKKAHGIPSTPGGQVIHVCTSKLAHWFQ